MDNNTKMREFFDELAPEWAPPDEEYDVRDRIVAMMQPGKNSLIADIGSGRGVMFPHLLKSEPRSLVSVELSSEMVRLAMDEHRDPRITFLNCDILEADLPEVDAALIFNAYPHFLDKRALGAKLAAHIKPGGIFVIAHSRSRETINGGHTGERVSWLSAPLREAETEAAEFSDWFWLDTYVDSNEIYFIRLLRKDISSS